MNQERGSERSLHERDGISNGTNQADFISLLDPLMPSLSRFCRAMCRQSGKLDIERAKDLASETVLKAYESFHKLRDRKAFQSYLFTIAVRINRQESRRSRRWMPLGKDVSDELAAPADGFEEKADIQTLYAAIKKLPQKQQEAVILSEIVGMKLEEVAEAQASTLSAVKSRVSRARQKLAELLGVHADPTIETMSVPVNGVKTTSSRISTPFQTPYAFSATSISAKEKL